MKRSQGIFAFHKRFCFCLYLNENEWEEEKEKCVCLPFRLEIRQNEIRMVRVCARFFFFLVGVYMFDVNDNGA